MVRNYQRKNGSRVYQTGYTDAALDEAIQVVRSGKSSLLQASKQFKIPYGTLQKKSKPGYVQGKKPGHPNALSVEEENSILQVINQLRKWRFPLSSIDIRFLVQTFLNGKGKKTVFVDNLPGPDWMKLFQSRHNLTRRISDNVKPSSSVEISHDEINTYFDHLYDVIDGIRPENIWNYEEINVTDNPDAKVCIVRRGLRRIDKKIASSKRAISVMFCGNAAGQFLPPMTVYKSKHLYSEWTQNGPESALYDHSINGSFDASSFEKWFFDLFLKAVKDIPGTKVMLGDNVTSHFSERVLEACQENNVKFVNLLPNATRLLQPLDVSVFGPAERMWREILAEWRKESQSKNSLPKNVFPSLLEQLYDGLSKKQEYLIAGFKACGIVPNDRDQVLKQLPPTKTHSMHKALGNAVASMLKDYISRKEKKSQKRGPKISPGTAISSCNLSDSHPSGVKKRKTVPPKLENSNEGDTEVCAICDQKNPHSVNTGIVDWEGCDQCDLWYHKMCLSKNGGSSGTDYCSCT